MTTSNQFKIESKLSEVKVMASHFRNFCSQKQIDENHYNLLELALVEALNNIIIHSYEKKSGFEITAKYEYLNSEIIITLSDFGKAFNERKKETKGKIHESELPEGNWGISIIESLTDEMIRIRDNNTNILILKKNT